MRRHHAPFEPIDPKTCVMGCRPRHNQLCHFFWKSVRGSRSWHTPKNGISYWKRSSPLWQRHHDRQLSIISGQLRNRNMVSLIKKYFPYFSRKNVKIALHLMGTLTSLKIRTSLFAKKMQKKTLGNTFLPHTVYDALLQNINWKKTKINMTQINW